MAAVREICHFLKQMLQIRYAEMAQVTKAHLLDTHAV